MEKKRFGWFRKKPPAASAPASGISAHPSRPPHEPHSAAGVQRTHSQSHRAGTEGHKNEKKLRIIPLGGLEEVGKNIMLAEYGDSIIFIDCGLSFADPDMMGVDYIVPDTRYAEERKHKVKGIIFTHGHLDHIGGVQHVLPKLGNPPLYATKLTAGLIRNRLREFGLEKTAKIHIYNEESRLKLGDFDVEFFRVNHSIPEGMGVYFKCPAGSGVHTGDFKFDYAPAVDKPADLQRIAQIGARGIDLLFSDSTNAMRPGFCKSEMEIGKNLETLVEKTTGRLIIASFSSLIGRINQICNSAAKYGKKIFLSGRSMIENMELAQELGYATYPKGVVQKISPAVNNLPPGKVVILTTGAQGETLSALTRMSLGEHAQIKIKPGDTVVISASPIPGNELAIVNVINNLYALGANVVTNNDMDVHVSGHGYQQEAKLMYSLIKPKCLVPIHGEYFMRAGHAKVIKDIAPTLQTTILENGDVLEVGTQGIRKSKEKIPANDIVIDGLGFGDIGSKVLKERKIMGEDGVVVLLFRAYEKTRNLIAEPDILSRGFLYVKEFEGLTSEIKKVAQRAFEHVSKNQPTLPLKDLKEELERNVSHFIDKRLKRNPMILPIILFI